MPRLQALASPSASPFPVLARLLWQCLALGLLAVLLLPAARGDSVLLGALPFWLLAAPAAALLALHRRFLAAAWRARRWGQITFPQAATGQPVASRGKCVLTPFSRPNPVARRTRSNPERPSVSSRAA